MFRKYGFDDHYTFIHAINAHGFKVFITLAKRWLRIFLDIRTDSFTPADNKYGHLR